MVVSGDSSEALSTASAVTGTGVANFRTKMRSGRATDGQGETA